MVLCYLVSIPSAGNISRAHFSYGLNRNIHSTLARMRNVYVVYVYQIKDSVRS